MHSYTYNSFDMMKRRLTEVDMLNLADLIYSLPFQKDVSIGGKEYLLAHAMTSPPSVVESKDYYLVGNWELECFFLETGERFYSKNE